MTSLRLPVPPARIAYAEGFALALPKGHRFPMRKYELIPQALRYEGIAADRDFFCPEELEDEIALFTHTEDYWNRFKNLELTDRDMRAIGFPLSSKLIERSRRIARGTIGCALWAMAHRDIALNTAGGTHHAFAGHGEGFCLLNDFAITANYLLNANLVQRILIVDLDVHQGNGTAKIFENEPQVFTFSMHGQHNYPFRKEKSDLDIALSDGILGKEYLEILAQSLPELLDNFQPEIVLYLAGVDVLATDKYGKMKLSQEDCYERDLFVFQECRKRNIPVAVSMGGGYSPEIKHIVSAHVNTFRAALGH
ncbi:MAG: histone deacetylase [Chitinophagaceae bacterium]